MKSGFVRYSLAALAGTSALALSGAAMAQAAEDVSDGGLDEIVVTANKREENLQKAPLAISAVSSEQLELRGLSEIRDLSAIAPSVSIVGGTTNATAAVVSIRGIPTPADESQGQDSPIGLYLDGVYLARSSAASFEVADIERVEVLRGPQGTLFGRNTTGGAINFITKRPDEEASLRVKLGIGNYDQLMGRFILNSGDLGGLRMSLGYIHRQRDGVVDNLLEPKDSRDPGGHRVRSLRFAAEIDVADNITAYNVFDYTRISGVPSVSQLAGVGDGVFRPNRNLDGSVFTGTVPAANVFAAVQPANIQGYLNSATILEPGCDKVVTRKRRSSICNELDDISTDKVWGNMFRIEAELDGVSIRSTSAYRKWENEIRGSDLDGLGSLRGPLFNIGSPAAPFAFFTGFPTSVLTNLGIPAGNAAFLTAGTVPQITQSLFNARNDRRQRQFSQEIELVSNGDGPFQWVLGGFYFDERGREVNPQSFGFVLDTNQAVYTPAALQNVLLGFGFPAATAAALAPGAAAAFQAANPARYRVVPQSSTLGYTSGGKSTAIYGQASYRPGGEDGAFGVTLGLRYTWDKKRVNRFQNGAAPFSAAEQALNIRRKSFSAPTGHLTVDYRADEDINLYARVARGYRSGGFNLRQSTSVANNIPLIPFNEESIWSYEIGAKTEFNNSIRLNFAAYHNVYSDQLATIPIPITGGGSFGTQIVNAGKTTYTGFEVEGQVRITDNFSIDGNFGYLDVKIKNFPGADTTGVVRNIAGPLLAGTGFAPKYTAAVAANLTVPISDETKVTGRVGYNYTSSYQMFPNTLTAPFSEITEGDARGLVDAQLRIDGIRFSDTGKGFGVMLWAKNLTNKKYVARAVDFGALGFGTVIFGDPRTYGLTLDFEF